jgi:hypothetical protein
MRPIGQTTLEQAGIVDALKIAFVAMLGVRKPAFPLIFAAKRTVRASASCPPL